MKKILGVFFKGIIALTPVVLTIYIMFVLYRFTDGLFKGMLQKAGFYFPGLGLLVTLTFIFLVGLLTSYWLTNKLFSQLERVFVRIPLIGSIYGVIKDTIKSISGNKKGFARLVMINLPNNMKLLGFLTNDDDQVFIPEGYVSVFIMQSMQWAGTLILVPENMVQPVEASTEEALKFIASAGLVKGKPKVSLEGLEDGRSELEN